MRLLLPALTVLVLVSGCARVPARVDTVQYINYSRIVEQQKDSGCNLIGLYRLASSKPSLITSPNEATPMLGEFLVAAIQRGSEIQFVSLSGYRDFGGLSDQGPGFSVNLQGSVLWTFKKSQCTQQNTKYIGKYTGIFDNIEGVATLEIIEGWTRIQVDFDDNLNASGKPNKAKDSTYFLTRMQ